MSKQEMRDPKQWAMLLAHLQEIIGLLGSKVRYWRE